MNDHDRSQLELIFETHFEAVYAYIAFRISPDFESAADLAQQVFEAAVLRWESIKNRDSIKPWLMEVARHKVADAFRKAGATRRALPLELAVDVSDPSDPQTVEFRKDRAIAVAH